MKISIDTKEDSIEDIKRLINMLQSFVQHRQHQGSGFVDMFGNNTESNTTDNKDKTGLFNIFGSNEDKETPKENKPEPKVQILSY